jgi:hypothetical protein
VLSALICQASSLAKQAPFHAARAHMLYAMHAAELSSLAAAAAACWLPIEFVHVSPVS